MGTTPSKWHPTWWKEETHGHLWELVRESMRRDWQQTKHDLGLGGHELNQSIGDTLKQASGAERLPNIDEANPPKEIGDWGDAEALYWYGYAARHEFGAQHPRWNPQLEATLKSEWMAAQGQAKRDWQAAVRIVRRGYEFTDAPTQPSVPPHGQQPHSSR